MNVNFVKEFGNNKYVIIDPNDDVQMKNIGLSSTPTFYIFNPKTQQTTKLSNPQFKQLFSSNLNELEKLLNSIIKLNVDAKYEEVKEEFKIEARNVFNNELDNQTFVRYAGEFTTIESIPDNLPQGSIFEINNEYKTEFYLVLNKDEIIRLYTKSDINEIFLNYYKNNQIDEFISKINNSIQSNYDFLNNNLDQLSKCLSGYVTTSDLLQYINKYKDHLNSEYLDNITNIQNNANLELENIRMDALNRLEILENDYFNLANDVVIEIEKFKADTIQKYEEKLNHLNEIITTLEIKINDLEINK